MTDLSPYILPPGYVQVCFSGGRTSGFLLRKILEANNGLPARAAVIFTNTGNEHPATLDFVADVSRRWGVQITWLEYAIGANSGAATYRQVDRETASQDGRPFEDVIAKRGFLPNQAARFCTVELKARTASRFLRDAMGWPAWHAALGIRKDEPRRLENTVRDAHGRRVANRYRDRSLGWYPLVDAGVTRRDVAAFWSRQPFDLGLASHNGKTPAGNCVGCFLKSEKTLAGLWRDMPEFMQWWRDQEARALARWNALTPAARDALIAARTAADLESLSEAYPDGIPPDVVAAIRAQAARPPTFSKRYAHADLAEQVERQGDLLFAIPGFFCGADDGDCSG